MSGLYGRGDYGVGPYGKAVEVPFRASGGARFDGSAWVQPQPAYRGRAAPFAYAGRARIAAVLRAASFRAAATSAGAAKWELRPLYRGQPVPWSMGGRVWWILDPGPDETIQLPAAAGCMAGRVGWRQDMRAVGWFAAARAAGVHRSNVQVQARGWRGSAAASGAFAPILLQDIDLLAGSGRFDGRQPHAVVGFKARRFRASGRFAGRARWGVRPVLRASAAARAGGRYGARVRFRGTFQPAPMRFAGAAAISYSWSNLTAPGRTPLDPWDTAPEAGGGWSAAPALSSQWGVAPAPADSWIEAPKAGNGWREVE